MKRLIWQLIRTVLALVLAVGLGIGTAWWSMSQTPGAFKNGPWQHEPLAGSVAAGPYSRAIVATGLPLALSNSEAVYLIAETDSDGNPLACDRTYRVEGRNVEARWWSLTCYDKEGYLIPNRQDRYSYNMTNVGRNADGRFSIRLSQAEAGGDWLPTGSGKSFQLVLRIYNPVASVRESLATVALPAIVREEPRHE